MLVIDRTRRYHPRQPIDVGSRRHLGQPGTESADRVTGMVIGHDEQDVGSLRRGCDAGEHTQSDETKAGAKSEKAIHDSFR